jgi:hypothetical protein
VEGRADLRQRCRGYVLEVGERAKLGSLRRGAVKGAVIASEARRSDGTRETAPMDGRASLAMTVWPV